MNQGYFERKMSQPSSSSASRSTTPRPYYKMPEAVSKSPNRYKHEFNQSSNHSPTTVSSQKNKNMNTSFGSSLKLSAKSKEQIPNTDRGANRGSQQYLYSNKNIGNTNNLVTELMGVKNGRSNYSINKTEPSVDLESSYMAQTNKLLQKINNLKFDLTKSQEREAQYLTKLSNLETENKTLQLAIEDKDKQMQEMMQRSKEEKLKMYQYLAEIEINKQHNTEQQYRDDHTTTATTGTAGSTMRSSDICDSIKKFDKVMFLEKGIQATEEVIGFKSCQKCKNISDYCGHLLEKIKEIDESSRYLLKEHNSMKESLLKAKRTESEYILACTEIEKRFADVQNNFLKQVKIQEEASAESVAIRKTLKEAMDRSLSLYPVENRENKVTFPKSGNFCSSNYPLPSSLKALIGAERVIKTPI